MRIRPTKEGNLDGTSTWCALYWGGGARRRWHLQAQAHGFGIKELHLLAGTGWKPSTR